MLATKKELRAIVLLIIISLTSGKPYQRVRRSIIKDYFNPLTYPTDLLQFKKGEDGKYHLSNPTDSNIDYAIAQEIDANNEIMGKPIKPSSSEKNVKIGFPVDAKNKEGSDTAFGEESKKEIEKGEVKGILIAENEKSEKISESEEKDILIKKEVTEKIDPDVKTEGIEKETGDKELESAAKSDIPVDSKWSLVPKPDGKDDKPFGSDDAPEEYFPEPPIVPEKEDGDGKLGIGQIPHIYPVLIPPSIPLFVPKRLIFRMSSMVPIPPAVHISDRLPLPDADVVEESAETAVVENVAPRGPIVIKEGRKFIANHFVNPLRIALRLPFMPVGQVLKEAVDEEKLKGHVKSEIVDINGKKMLLQRKLLKSPSDDPSHLHVSVMSVQPLEEVDPAILKEIEKENKELEIEDTFHGKEMKHEEEEDVEGKTDKEIFPEDPKKIDELPVLKESQPEPEFLEVEKSEIDEKEEVVEVIPPIVPDFEKTMKHEEEKKIKESEDKDEAEAAEDSEEDEDKNDFAAKRDIHIVDELGEKKEDTDIVLAEEEKKNKEIVTDDTDVKNKERDEIIRPKNLFHLANRRKNKNGIADGIITEIESSDAFKDENGFKVESQIKDKETAGSEIVEIAVKPIEESKSEFKKVGTEIKAIDEEEKLNSDHKTAHGIKEEGGEEEVEEKDKEEKEKEEKEKEDKEEEDKEEEKKDAKETDVKDVDHSEEKEFKTKDLEITKAEGAIFIGRKKELDIEKKKGKKKPKKKCKCEEEDSESDSDGE
ncbi:uncharacterized protein NPIL_531281 [Nephila pilipes]|uniref:Uncharacterized protein n=1 Tax=Nephila pilipes TaxID=299642 RepID=A0A8X6NFY6_NEPPI|nr:uncharacterized protein NPIL_531281 [Nephila pilipes]